MCLASIQADILMGTDALQTFLEPGDEGLENPERMFNLGSSLNTGMLLIYPARDRYAI